jgi:hypothetical protein
MIHSSHRASLFVRLRQALTIRSRRFQRIRILSLFGNETRKERSETVTVELTKNTHDAPQRSLERSPADLKGDQDCACE